MKRIMLTVAYDGTAYSGWQIQPNAPTIEGALNKAIGTATGENIQVIGASRTDAGVHAYGNIAVFDTNSTIPPDRFLYTINRWLPPEIRVLDSCEVDICFHPRHCDTIKTYEYTILQSKVELPQFYNYAWHVRGNLNIDSMKKAAAFLIGEHDFKSFCCVRTQAESTIRTIYSIEILKESVSLVLEDTYLVKIRVTGNGFLYNMVRIIAGTLVQVGKGQFLPQHMVDMLEKKERCAAGQTAPPQGLALMQIKLCT